MKYVPIEGKIITALIVILVLVGILVACAPQGSIHVEPTSETQALTPHGFVKIGSMGLHEVYEYHSSISSMDCLILRECNGINCSVAVSCVR